MPSSWLKAANSLAAMGWNSRLPLRSSIEDVATPASGTACDCSTDDPDGILDLTLKFKSRDLAAAIGPVIHGDVVVLTLMGSLLDGTPFEGSDCIVALHPGPGTNRVNF